jgi:ubiquinone/menaquinone biosynthesis C-methylase UbiE
MIRLASEQEQREPRGIEYRLGAVQELPVIAKFDVVTAVFLLNYAQSPPDLLEMCRVVFRNLNDGCRFLTINENLSRSTADGLIYRKYGFAFPGDRPTGDADPLPFALQTSAETWIQIEARYFRRETYEWALRAAGFREVGWHDLVIPEELLAQEGDEYWSDLTTGRPIALIECLK